MKTCILRTNLQLFRILQLKRQDMLQMDDRCLNGIWFRVTDLATMLIHDREPVVKLASGAISDALSCRQSAIVQRSLQFETTNAMLRATTVCIRHDLVFIALGLLVGVALKVAKNHTTARSSVATIKDLVVL